MTISLAAVPNKERERETTRVNGKRVENDQMAATNKAGIAASRSSNSMWLACMAAVSLSECFLFLTFSIFPSFPLVTTMHHGKPIHSWGLAIETIFLNQEAGEDSGPSAQHNPNSNPIKYNSERKHACRWLTHSDGATRAPAKHTRAPDELGVIIQIFTGGELGGKNARGHCATIYGIRAQLSAVSHW